MSTAEFLAPSYIMSFRSRRRRHQTPSATFRGPATSAASPIPSTRNSASSSSVSRDNSPGSASVDPDPPAFPNESSSIAYTTSSPSSSSLLLEGARAGFASATQVVGSSSSSKKLTNARSDFMEPTSSNNCVGHGQQDCSSCTGGQSSSDEQCTQSRHTASERMLSAAAPMLQPNSSSTSHRSSIRKHPMDKADMEECAICLDKILPRQHAQAILACRHEFHLSCISMAFAVGNEMVCPLCRYLHKDQPFMNQEAEEGEKSTAQSFGHSSHTTTSTSTSTSTATSPHQRHHSIATLHEHPTSGTVLSMMPSLFETSLGHGPAAGTIRTSPDGIFLKTSTWLLLYAMPFSVALCFLSFVLGKVETMWSKISCLIGAAICYIVCWALVVAVMNPDHEARAILERLSQLPESPEGPAVPSESAPQAPEFGSNAMQVADPTEVLSGSTFLAHGTRPQADEREVFIASSGSMTAIAQDDATAPPLDSLQTPLTGLLPITFSTWALNSYAVDLQQRVQDLADILDDLPDMMAEW